MWGDTPTTGASVDLSQLGTENYPHEASVADEVDTRLAAHRTTLAEDTPHPSAPLGCAFISPLSSAASFS